MKYVCAYGPVNFRVQEFEYYPIVLTYVHILCVFVFVILYFDLLLFLFIFFGYFNRCEINFTNSAIATYYFFIHICCLLTIPAPWCACWAYAMLPSFPR